MTTFRNIAASCLVVLATTALSACVENRASVTILYNAVPESDCTVDPDSDQFRPAGTLDISGPYQWYRMHPVIQNNLASTLEQGSLVEQNIIEIVEARVDLSGATSASFAQPMWVTLFPGDIAPLAVDVIPYEEPPSLSPGIVYVKLKFLYQLGGLERETHEVEYSISVCSECLLIPGTACDSGVYATVEQTGNLCNLVQDAPVQCCTDPSGGLVCPAVDTSIPE